MELNKLVHVYITDTVSICHKEWLVPYIFLDTLDSSSSHCIKTCINYCNLPWLTMLLVNNHIVRTLCEVKRNITVVKEIIRKPFFNYILLISCTYNKLIKTIISIFLHNMPENWLSSYLYHWLWLKLTFFTYSCSETSSQ